MITRYDVLVLFLTEEEREALDYVVKHVHNTFLNAWMVDNCASPHSILDVSLTWSYDKKYGYAFWNDVYLRLHKTPSEESLSVIVKTYPEEFI